MATLQETHAAQIEEVLGRYADRRSAVLPVLYLAQDTYGTLTPAVIREVATTLDLPYTDIFEVVGFYTLFYDQPFGKWVVQVCDDVPCCYLGAEELITALKQHLKLRENETTADGMFTLQRVKCLAACHRPPVVQANLCYFYDVTVDRMDAFLRFLREHATTPEAASVSGHSAEDYEPGPDGTFRLIERRLGALVGGRPPATGDGHAPTTDGAPAAAQAAAEQQMAEEAGVAESPDRAPAGAFPVGEPGVTPGYAAQQQPPQEQGTPAVAQPSPDRLGTGAPGEREREEPNVPGDASKGPPAEGEAQAPLLDRPADKTGAGSET